MEQPVINKCVTGYKSNSYAKAVMNAYNVDLFRMSKVKNGHGTEEEAYEALDNWQRWKL